MNKKNNIHNFVRMILRTHATARMARGANEPFATNDNSFVNVEAKKTDSILMRQTNQIFIVTGDSFS